ADWMTPKTVTITGVNDDVDDGDIAYTILTAGAVSGDGKYNGLDAADVSVTNTDDDTAGITVAPTAGLVTTEAGGTAQFTVMLDTEPTADVTVTVASDDATEGNVVPMVLMFTSQNWNVAQTVTVTGVDDEVDDGDVLVTILTSVSSSDPGYDALDAADVSVTNQDDDEGFVPIDLGQVDFRQLGSLAPGGQELWFRLETVHDGWLTVQSTAQWTAGQLALELYNPADHETPLAASNTSDAIPRFDYLVEQGQIWLLKVTGSATNVTLAVANLVHELDGAITVYGTDQADKFILDAAASRTITINGVAYHHEDTEVSTVDFSGGQGRDEAWLYDSTGNESLEAWPDHTVWTNGAGDAQQDYVVQVSGIEDLLAYATRGGTDSALFHGSENADKLKSYEDSVRLRAGNSSYSLRAKLFDTIESDSGTGGKDIAVFDGSEGDDVFHYNGADNSAQMEGTRRYHAALGFDSVTVRAGNGENDVAWLTDLPGIDDVLYFKSHKTQLVSTSVNVSVRAFDEVHATADQSGFDVARISDTTGDDHLEVAGDTARLYHRIGTELDLLYEAIGFERVKAYSTEGDDTTDIGDHSIDLLLYGWDRL
ncbi:MAG: hypothetical protein ACYC6Y_10395, partial [Thermoguttaceae bacterium]